MQYVWGMHLTYETGDGRGRCACGRVLCALEGEKEADMEGKTACKMQCTQV